MASHPYIEVVPTAEQNTRLETVRSAFMTACPFYAHFFYSTMREVFTLDIPTAATDGRHLIVNPEYISGLKVQEGVFAYAHETDHAVCRDPQRMKAYTKANEVPASPNPTPWDQMQFNVAADYVRNALLIETGVGLCNPEWCFAPDVTGDELIEDVYARKYQQPIEQTDGWPGIGRKGQGQKPGKQPGGGGGSPDDPSGRDQGQIPKPSTYGESGRGPRGGKPDPQAAANNGRFDELLPPPIDPVTGKEDLPDEMEFKEAVARAAAAAKAMGKLPSQLKKRVDELLEPQVNWRDHLRMVVTGRIGARHETWDRPNRRRLVLNPMVVMPGKRGYGANLVVVALDTSGSIYGSPKALEAFFSEVAGILADVKPRRVILIECDASIGRVSEAGTLDELDYSRKQGVTGGGGTSFIPPFEYLAKEQLRPDTLVYLTDLVGQFPDKPDYPVVWCTILDGPVPFGDKVFVDV
jgi:hypothetical protein